ncbi:hypothetical protein GIB67_014594 [Kingdonia uniflora]|uniref:MHD domain-containing protein n=1 Tax=Kingdonia uniflora TaxID=39325 RepID=A0A7J7MNU1_9MAGN|nr:hypothetical protein GIB67_014594 [Kingdonia uniflora]
MFSVISLMGVFADVGGLAEEEEVLLLEAAIFSRNVGIVCLAMVTGDVKSFGEVVEFPAFDAKLLKVEVVAVVASEVRPVVAAVWRRDWRLSHLKIFLCRVADVLSDYLGGLNEDLIKDNFVIVYQLLDEMIDNGFPLTTEPNILREMIAPPNLVSKVLSVVTGNSSNVSNTLPGATGSCVPWRTAATKHSNNEVYFDLVEEMDAIINSNGILVKCEIYGEVQVNSYLSGLPDLTLTFANPSILNDVRFHPCVRFRPWESHQMLSFVPPDGLFKLMSYRVKKLKNAPIYVKPQLTSDAGTCRITVLVGIKNDSGKTIDSITVQFQLPPCVASANLTSNHGTVNIFTDKTCSWSIGRIPKDRSPSMSGTLVLETGMERLHVFPTFQVGFKIMGVALSGLQIDKLDFKNLPKLPYKGFRALTRAGHYDVRS